MSIRKGSIRIYDPQLGRDRFIMPIFNSTDRARYVGHLLKDHVGKLCQLHRVRIGPLTKHTQCEVSFPPNRLTYWVTETDLEPVYPAAPVTLADATNQQLIDELARRLG
jgi:hypothetical protein